MFTSYCDLHYHTYQRNLCCLIFVSLCQQMETLIVCCPSPALLYMYVISQLACKCVFTAQSNQQQHLTP